MAVMADFARMPTQRKVLVFVIAGALLFGLYYQFALKSLDRKLAAARADHSAKQSLNSQYEADLPKYEALKTQMTKLQRTLKEEEKALPTEAELPAFFETLNRKVLESGVEVKSSQRMAEQEVQIEQPDPADPKKKLHEVFFRVPVNFEITGTFMQIKKFFASLATKIARDPGPPGSGDGDNVADEDRIVSIENLKVGDPQVVNHELVLHATFTAMTYREEAPPEEPARAKAAAPAAGAKKLPPADTPAGAKARVDNAVDKGTAKLKAGAP